MKVLLINPPAKKVIVSSFPKCFHDIRGIHPPLGLLYLWSYLQKTQPHHSIKIFDACSETYSEKAFQELLLEFQPDVVGVQIFTFTLLDSVDIFTLTKQTNPNIITVAGGPHVSLYHRETLCFPVIDYAIAGEGEQPFSDLIYCLENDLINITGIKGLAYRSAGEVFVNQEHNSIENLDLIPVINRELIPYKKYYSVFSRNKLMTTIITSRGCPYRCVYCSNFNQKVRAHSPRYVVEEIKSCIKLGITEIFIIDDTFSFNIKRAKEICRIIIKEKILFKWCINTRINTMDDELLSLLKLAGCKRVNYGIESGSQRIIHNIQKKIDLGDALNIIKKTKLAGLEVYCFFMIGLPGETLEDIQATIKFLNSAKPDFAQFTITTLEPGTELYSMAIERGIVDRDVWKDFAIKPNENFRSPVWTENFSEAQLQRILNSLYKKYYLSPRFIIKNVFDKNNWVNFSKTISAIFKIIKM